MEWVGIFVAVARIVVIFVDALEAVILPRRIKHRYRLAPASAGGSRREPHALASGVLRVTTRAPG